MPEPDSLQNAIEQLQGLFKEQQALAAVQKAQFDAIKGTVEAIQMTELEQTQKDDHKHTLYMQEMDAMRLEREALMDILTTLQSAIESMQTAELALINTTDQLVELANARFMPRQERERSAAQGA